MLFDKNDYDTIHSIVFRDGYPGYKPEVIELPNGDGNADSLKRYAHIAPKYLDSPANTLYPGKNEYLRNVYAKAFGYAEKLFKASGGHDTWRPEWNYSALRILDYPPGATSAAHKDFDLFTTMLYRDQPECFLMYDEPSNLSCATLDMRKIDHQVHIGEMGEMLGMGSATLHGVRASETRQHSIVFFAIPDHDNVLKASFKGNLTVRDWLNERMQRSRTSFDNYK